MAGQKFVTPEYFKRFEGLGPITSDYNFGLEGTLWSGGKIDENGDMRVDPDVILREHGHDPYPPLHYLILMLVKGHNSDLNDRETFCRVRKAHDLIVGEKPRRGAPKKGYHDLLLEIAWRYFEEFDKAFYRDDEVILSQVIRDAVGDRVP